MGCGSSRAVAPSSLREGQLEDRSPPPFEGGNNGCGLLGDVCLLISDVLAFLCYVTSFAAIWRTYYLLRYYPWGRRTQMRSAGATMLGHSLVDIILLPFGVITVLSWRSLGLLRALKAVWDKPEEVVSVDHWRGPLRDCVCEHFGLLVLDLLIVPTIPAVLIAVTAPWRWGGIWESFRAVKAKTTPEVGEQRRVGVVFWGYFVTACREGCITTGDWLLLPFLVFGLCSWRGPRIALLLWGTHGKGTWIPRRRGIVVKEVFRGLVLDVPCAVPLALNLLCVWRIPNLLRRVRRLQSDPGNFDGDVPLGKWLGVSYHGCIGACAVETVLDLMLLPCYMLLFLTVYRLPALLATSSRERNNKTVNDDDNDTTTVDEVHHIEFRHRVVTMRMAGDVLADFGMLCGLITTCCTLFKAPAVIRHLRWAWKGGSVLRLCVVWVTFFTFIVLDIPAFLCGCLLLPSIVGIIRFIRHWNRGRRHSTLAPLPVEGELPLYIESITEDRGVRVKGRKDPSVAVTSVVVRLIPRIHSQSCMPSEWDLITRGYLVHELSIELGESVDNFNIWVEGVPEFASAPWWLGQLIVEGRIARDGVFTSNREILAYLKLSGELLSWDITEQGSEYTVASPPGGIALPEPTLASIHVVFDEGTWRLYVLESLHWVWIEAWFVVACAFILVLWPHRLWTVVRRYGYRRAHHERRYVFTQLEEMAAVDIKELRRRNMRIVEGVTRACQLPQENTLGTPLELPAEHPSLEVSRCLPSAEAIEIYYQQVWERESAWLEAEKQSLAMRLKEAGAVSMVWHCTAGCEADLCATCYTPELATTIHPDHPLEYREDPYCELRGEVWQCDNCGIQPTSSWVISHLPSTNTLERDNNHHVDVDDDDDDACDHDNVGRVPSQASDAGLVSPIVMDAHNPIVRRKIHHRHGWGGTQHVDDAAPVEEALEVEEPPVQNAVEAMNRLYHEANRWVRCQSHVRLWHYHRSVWIALGEGILDYSAVVSVILVFITIYRVVPLVTNVWRCITLRGGTIHHIQGYVTIRQLALESGGWVLRDIGNIFLFAILFCLPPRGPVAAFDILWSWCTKRESGYIDRVLSSYPYSKVMLAFISFVVSTPRDVLWTLWDIVMGGTWIQAGILVVLTGLGLFFAVDAQQRSVWYIAATLMIAVFTVWKHHKVHHTSDFNSWRYRRLRGRQILCSPPAIVSLLSPLVRGVHLVVAFGVVGGHWTTSPWFRALGSTSWSLVAAFCVCGGGIYAWGGVARRPIHVTVLTGSEWRWWVTWCRLTMDTLYTLVVGRLAAVVVDHSGSSVATSTRMLASVILIWYVIVALTWAAKGNTVAKRRVALEYAEMYHMVRGVQGTFFALAPSVLSGEYLRGALAVAALTQIALGIGWFRVTKLRPCTSLNVAMLHISMDCTTLLAFICVPYNIPLVIILVCMVVIPLIVHVALMCRPVVPCLDITMDEIQHTLLAVEAEAYRRGVVVADEAERSAWQREVHHAETIDRLAVLLLTFEYHTKLLCVSQSLLRLYRRWTYDVLLLISPSEYIISPISHPGCNPVVGSYGLRSWEESARGCYDSVCQWRAAALAET